MPTTARKRRFSRRRSCSHSRRSVCHEDDEGEGDEKEGGEIPRELAEFIPAISARQARRFDARANFSAERKRWERNWPARWGIVFTRCNVFYENIFFFFFSEEKKYYIIKCYAILEKKFSWETKYILIIYVCIFREWYLTLLLRAQNISSFSKSVGITFQQFIIILYVDCSLTLGTIGVKTGWCNYL